MATEFEALDHLKRIAKQQQIVTRLEGEALIAKDNLKAANTVLSLLYGGISPVIERSQISLFEPNKT